MKLEKKHGLERYLYFLVCDDDNFLSQLYEGYDFMNEVIKKQD